MPTSTCEEYIIELHGTARSLSRIIPSLNRCSEILAAQLLKVLIYLFLLQTQCFHWLCCSALCWHQPGISCDATAERSQQQGRAMHPAPRHLHPVPCPQPRALGGTWQETSAQQGIAPLVLCQPQGLTTHESSSWKTLRLPTLVLGICFLTLCLHFGRHISKHCSAWKPPCWCLLHEQPGCPACLLTDDTHRHFLVSLCNNRSVPGPSSLADTWVESHRFIFSKAKASGITWWQNPAPGPKTRHVFLAHPSQAAPCGPLMPGQRPRPVRGQGCRRLSGVSVRPALCCRFHPTSSLLIHAVKN